MAHNIVHRLTDSEKESPIRIPKIGDTKLAEKAREYSVKPLKPITMFPPIFKYFESNKEPSASLSVVDKKNNDQVGKLFLNEGKLWVEIQSERCEAAIYQDRFFLTPESAEKVAKNDLKRETAEQTRNYVGSWASNLRSRTDSGKESQRDAKRSDL